MLEIDTNTEWGARVARRLRDETMIWLTTVNASGAPQPSAVWFLWFEGNVLIYSKPDMPKLRNIARNPAVALHFDGNGRGGDLVVITGKAELGPQTPPADEMPAYVEKYAPNIARNGWTAAQFAQMYSVALWVTPSSVRGH